MDFILSRLPRAKYHIFVDASTSWGVGGCCGNYYFKFTWAILRRWIISVDIIARMELLSALISILCFDDLIYRRLVSLHIDNDNAYTWLRKSRCTNARGTEFLAMWEYGKYITECKVTPVWIPSEANRSADALSRGVIPPWLKRMAVRRSLTYRHLRILTEDPVKTWLNAMN